jgi:hypothetical protein
MVSVTVIDSLYYDLKPLKKTLEILSNKINRVHWFSDIPFPEKPFHVPVTWTKISKIKNYNDEYGYITLKLCPSVCTENYNLIIHNDGFAVNADAWTDEFLEYDYIGATWTDGFVGNGGFCLRSRKLYDALLDMNIPYDTNSYKDYFNGDFYSVISNGNKLVPEDSIICKIHKSTLETKYGIKFAPQQIADRFSIEHNMSSPWLGKSLGFHGKHGIHKYYGVDL